MRRWVLVTGYLVTATFFGLLVWQTGADAIRSFQLNEMIMGAVYVTIWPAKLALPIGFVAAFLMVLANAYQAATDPDFDPSPAVPEESAPE
jgi:TRAP-type C4-dicarboxylate transport system permease small subunit